VHAMNRRLEEYLPSVAKMVDWTEIEALRDTLIDGGRRFFNVTMNAMRDSGVDVNDPAAVLMVMRGLGSVAFEELFGAGDPDKDYPRGRRPVLETDLVHQTMNERRRLLDAVNPGDRQVSLRGVRVAVASTDVHEFAKFLIEAALNNVGAKLIDVGVNRDPEDIVHAVVESAADVIVITTHNGVAKSFAEVLTRELRVAKLERMPVFMGGVLNEDTAGSEIPVDVRSDLVALGVTPLSDIESLVGILDQMQRTGSGVAS
jgi:methylmalonyl-CoA mutase cobalamin-binding subunit